MYTETEVIHDTSPSYRIDFLTERHKKYFLRPTNITLDGNKQVKKKLYLIQYYKT